MSYSEIFWNMFEKLGSVDAYIGYADCKKRDIEENAKGFYEYF